MSFLPTSYTRSLSPYWWPGCWAPSSDHLLLLMSLFISCNDYFLSPVCLNSSSLLEAKEVIGLNAFYRRPFLSRPSWVSWSLASTGLCSLVISREWPSTWFTFLEHGIFSHPAVRLEGISLEASPSLALELGKEKKPRLRSLWREKGWQGAPQKFLG